MNQPAAKSLSAVVRGRINKPQRVLLYGPEGVGKTSFGADAPSPIFLGAEDGTEHLDVARIPTAQLRTWPDVMQWLAVLSRDPHEYQTLVIDTVDWLEPLVHMFVAQQEGKANIEDIPFASGYKRALSEWRALLERLDFLRDRRGMWVVLLAHSKITKFDDPASASWDRYSLKVHDRPSASAADVLKEWADCVLFATFDERARQKNSWDRKATGTGKRIIHTERSAAWDAKNRHNLPPTIELSWQALYAHITGSQDLTGDALARELTHVRELAAELPEAARAKVHAWCEQQQRAGRLARAQLGRSVNRIRCMVDEHRQDEPPPAQPQPPGDAYGTAAAASSFASSVAAAAELAYPDDDPTT